MNRAVLMTLLALLVLPLAATPTTMLHVSGGWVRATPPQRSVAAAYFVIHNAGTSPIALVGAESSRSRVELHTMLREDGMMRMRPLDSLEIPAGSNAALTPGGAHLMLFDVDATRAGTVIELELLFEGDVRLPVSLPVLRQAPTGD